MDIHLKDLQKHSSLTFVIQDIIYLCLLAMHTLNQLLPLQYIEERIWCNSSNAGTNLVLGTQQLEAASVILSSKCCRWHSCQCHMELQVEICSHFGIAQFQLSPLGSNHQFCRLLWTCTLHWIDQQISCSSSMVWLHGNPTFRKFDLIHPRITFFFFFFLFAGFQRYGIVICRSEKGYDHRDKNVMIHPGACVFPRVSLFFPSPCFHFFLSLVLLCVCVSLG